MFLDLSLITATRDDVPNFKVRELQPSTMVNIQPRCKTCVGSAGKHPTSPEIKPKLTKSRGKPAESLLLKDIYKKWEIYTVQIMESPRFHILEQLMKGKT